MSDTLQPEENLFWDPVYITLAEYAKDFDYDLRGEKVSKQVRFLEDPVEHMQHIVRDYQLELIVVGSSVIMLLFGFIMTKNILLKGSRYILNAILFFVRILLQKLRRNRMEKKGNGDYDTFAASVYRVISNFKGIYRTRGDTDLVEYESTRFAWEAVQPTGLGYGELVKALHPTHDDNREIKSSGENVEEENGDEEEGEK